MGNPHAWSVDRTGQRRTRPASWSHGRLLWERANGKSIRLLKLVPPVESFAETSNSKMKSRRPSRFFSCSGDFSNSYPLAWRFYLVAKELTLKINFSDKRVTNISFQIPQPTGNVEILFRMLQTHLENFTSESPIVAVSLEAHPAKLSGQQFGLFETALAIQRNFPRRLRA